MESLQYLNMKPQRMTYYSTTLSILTRIVHGKLGLGALQVPHVYTCLKDPDAQVDGNRFAVHVRCNFVQVLPALQCATCMLLGSGCQHDVHRHDRVLDAQYNPKAFSTSAFITQLR